MSSRRIVIAGGSGFIGRALAAEFTTRGFGVVVLTRSPRRRQDGIREVAWDGVGTGAWVTELEGAAAVINLAGKNLNCRHTPANLREIIASRVDSVRAIAAAMVAAKQPARVWVQASAVGYYGDTGAVACNEEAPAGRDHLAEVCRQWEAAFRAERIAATRKVVMRIGFVLGREGGALPVLCGLTRLFLGGAAGSGRQYISWIHLADLTAMFIAAVMDDGLSGTFNAVGPTAVTNAAFMQALRGVMQRPWSPPAPAQAVKLGAWLLGSEGSLALVSQRCVPQRFLEAGFAFRFGELAPALRDLCAPSGKATLDSEGRQPG
jgi:uncharacterized protein (TIGR01777 family)